MDLIADLQKRRTLLTTAEVAEILNVKPAAICHYVKHGRLKAIRLSKQALRFQPGTVIDFLEAEEVAFEKYLETGTFVAPVGWETQPE